MDAAFPLITPRFADADLIGLRHLRREMEEALFSYDRFVQEEICDLSLWSIVGEAHADAKAMRTACKLLRSDYDTFIDRWSTRDVRANWIRYRLAARCMMQQVRDHILDCAAMSKRWAISEAA